MAIEFKLPDLGEGIDSAEVVRVLVSDGDSVQENQPVLEVEAEKAALEVPSAVAGQVSEVHVKEGDTVRIGQTILSLEAGPEAGDGRRVGAREEGGEGKPPEAREPERKRPAVEEAPEREKRPEGTRAEAGEAVAEEKPEEEAARKMPEAEAAEPTPATGAAEARQASGVHAQRAPAEEREAVAAAPSVRQLARESGVDIAEVRGSGPGGRISIDDVKEHARQRGIALPEEAPKKAPKEAPKEAPPPPPARAERPHPEGARPDFEKFGSIYREPINSVRRTMARQMSLSWSTIPHVTLFEEADVTALEALRERYQARAEESGGKLTITAIMLKIAAVALRVFPRLNASVDPEGDEIIYKQYYHLGVATDTLRGLLVPVIRNVDQKGIVQLSVELAQVVERARHGMLSREEMQGASFTVTSLGGIGTTFFTPIINPPEVAILGLGRIRPDGQPEPGTEPRHPEPPRLMLPLSLSIDHRVVDGAEGARFLQWILEAVHQPLMLAMEE